MSETELLNWTVRDLRKFGREFLHRKLDENNLDVLGLEADLLLAKVLDFSKESLYSHSENQASDIQFAKYNSLLQRRSMHEPIAYILGCKEFYGYKYYVSSDVLIPRPETEALVEHVLRYMSERKGSVLLIDVGCGSGCIVLSIAAELSRISSSIFSLTHFLASDISFSALKIAYLNASLHNLSDRVDFVVGNLLSPLLSDSLSVSEVVIVANLPYVPDSEVLPEDVSCYEPHLALRGGEKGLDIIRQLIDQLGSLYAKNSFELKAFFEIGAGQYENVEAMLLEKGFSNICYHKDFQNIKRIVEVN